MNDTNRQLKWKRISYYSNERHHVNEVNNAILYIYYYFPFFSIRYLNAVKYTRRLSTEYPPELRRVPGLIESTVILCIFYAISNEKRGLISVPFLTC